VLIVIIPTYDDQTRARVENCAALGSGTGKTAEGGGLLDCGAGHRVWGVGVVYCLPRSADAMKHIAALGSLRSAERAYPHTEEKR
jgi:hypothetical protein